MSETTESEALLRFMENLKQAAGCASQLGHHQQNDQWFTIRNLLENVRTTAMTMATSKPVSRQELLRSIDKRVIGRA